MHINIRTGARYSTKKGSNGMGRVWQELERVLLRRNDVCIESDWRKADIQVVICFPYDRWDAFLWYGRERHPISLLYTTWETTMLPEFWVEVMNTFQGVIAASTFNESVFKESGVTVPIYVVPHGVDRLMFRYIERDWSANPFVFLWQGMQINDRKGAYYAEKGFEIADLENAILIEKLYPCVTKEMPLIVSKLGNRIRQIRSIMEFRDYVELLSKCHVSVNPYRGEGFGLMPMECAMTGMATMATDWSGPVDYMDDSFRKIKYDLCEPGEDYVNSSPLVETVTPPAQDAIPDVDHIAEGMRFLYENRDIAYEMGLTASKKVKRWTWEKAADRLVKTLEKTLDGRLQKRVA